MDERSSLRFGAGVMASLLLHALGALGLGLAPAVWSQPQPARDANTPRIRPGIERSRTATINWLGFENPTPHQAPQSQIDQPQLALNPGETQTAEPTTPVSEPAPQPAPDQTPPVEELRAEAPDAPQAPSTAEAPPARPSDDAPAPVLAVAPFDPEAFVGPPAPPERSPTTTGVNDAERAQQQRPISDEPTPQQAQANAGEPATDAGKDAEASSRDEPIDIVLGRPVAAPGVDITTVRPRWTLYTRMTASPRNPLIEVHFDRIGQVIHARMLEGSGRSDVDSPLMDAVYNWRATGKAIDVLSQAEGESARLILRFRIGLR